MTETAFIRFLGDYTLQGLRVGVKYGESTWTVRNVWRDKVPSARLYIWPL